MPIKYTCSCGKVLQIKDELVGKKLKCPGCQKVFLATAPGTKGPAGAKPTAPSAPAKPKEAIKPAAKSAPPPKRPAPKPAAEGDEFFSEMGEAPPKKPVRSKAPPPEDEDEDETPVRGKGKAGVRGGKKSSKMLLIILAAVLVLGGGGGGYYFFFMQPSTPTRPGPQAKGKGGPVVPGPGEQKEDPKQDEPKQEGPNKEPIGVPAGDDLSLIPGDTLFVASMNFDLAKAKLLETLLPVKVADFDDQFGPAVGLSINEVERLTLFLLGTYEEAQGSKDPPVIGILKTRKPLDAKKAMAYLKSLPEKDAKDVSIQTVKDGIYLVGKSAEIKRYQAAKLSPTPSNLIGKAQKVIGASKGLVIAAVLPENTVKGMTQGMTLKEAPPFVLPFLKTREVLLTVDLGDRLDLKITLGMEDVAAAAEAKKASGDLIGFGRIMLGSMGKNPQMGSLIKEAEKILGQIAVDAKDKDLSIAVQIEGQTLANAAQFIIGAWMMKGAMPPPPEKGEGEKIEKKEKVRGSASDAQEMNNLKQIALAFHAYHDFYKTFPPQNFRGGLSWRVAILPFIEQKPLYDAFKLDEPWDSEHNIKLLGKMPQIYAPISGKGPPLETFFQVFVGPKTLNADPKKGKGFAQIPDGTSNTLLVAESAKAVPWTKPEDIEVKAEDLPMLGATPQGFFLAALADGSVRKFPQKLDPKLLRNLIDPADLNPIDWKQIDPSRPGPTPFPSKEFQKKVEKGLIPKEQPEEVNSTEKKEAEPKVAATKPGLPRVSKITRARAAELGDGKQLTPTNRAADVVVVVKIENLPAKFESFTLFREGAFLAGGQKRNFNSLTAPAAGSYIWAAGIIPASARKMTINLGRSVPPLSVDLPPTIDDRSKVGE